MIERRDKRETERGRFIKGNVPWNKRLDNTQGGTIFTCRFCGKPKPIEELEVVSRFFPPLPIFPQLDR